MFQDAVPDQARGTICEWAEKHVRLPGSARSEAFRADIAPWLVEVINRCGEPETRSVTFVKPVQTGGSVVGEIVTCWAIRHFSSGDIQGNWEDDDKAGERWDKRIFKILSATKPVADLMPDSARNNKRRLIIFPHLNLTVQGVFTESNLGSDSIRLQVNEEIHRWGPGVLRQAHRRLTAYWNSLVLNISNASIRNDQLHQAFNTGTRQYWEVKCPGCGAYHRMRTRWEEDKPELGGLRYESKRNDDGDYDYREIAKTLRYQMPCGHIVHDDIAARRALSVSGRYSAPENPGAPAGYYSYTLDAVAIDYIPWITLVEEKHDALRALSRGDPRPYEVYIKERECNFWDPDNRPHFGKVVSLLKGAKKSREGLPDRASRFFSLDRQQGDMSAGEMPHWWLLIRDAMENGDSRLVFEGKCLTDEEAVGVLKDHGCLMRCGVADSGDDTKHVYQFCLRHGINAVKGAGQDFFHHENGARRIYSPERPLHAMVNAPPLFPYSAEVVDGEVKRVPHQDEPLFWFYSKPGVLDRLAWIRELPNITNINGEMIGDRPKWEVPDDVSKEYISHMQSWVLRDQEARKTKETVKVWEKVQKRDDLHWCERMIVMLMEMAGYIGEPR